MSEQEEDDLEPDWDTPLELRLSPGEVVHALFASADQVHTGWASCVDAALVLEDTTVTSEQGENHCRLVKLAYVEDQEPDETWNDWTVELHISEIYVVGHWRTRETAAPVDLDWCQNEAEKAFAAGCVLVGRRVRRGLVVDEAPVSARRPSRTHH